jgi:hypothetical protein
VIARPAKPPHRNLRAESGHSDADATNSKPAEYLQDVSMAETVGAIYAFIVAGSIRRLPVRKASSMPWR